MNVAFAQDRLLRFADGKVVLALEGGYNVRMTAECATQCMHVLLGAAPPMLPGDAHAAPRKDAAAVLQAVAEAQAPFWYGRRQDIVREIQCTLLRDFGAFWLPSDIDTALCTPLIYSIVGVQTCLETPACISLACITISTQSPGCLFALIISLAWLWAAIVSGRALAGRCWSPYAQRICSLRDWRASWPQRAAQDARPEA